MTTPADSTTSTTRSIPDRRQILNLLFTISVPTRKACVWEIPRPLWAAVKRDPDLRSNWHEEGVRIRVLFDIPVRLTENGRFRLTIDVG